MWNSERDFLSQEVYKMIAKEIIEYNRKYGDVASIFFVSLCSKLKSIEVKYKKIA